jgi:hypothetical protein
VTKAAYKNSERYKKDNICAGFKREVAFQAQAELRMGLGAKGI